MANRIKHWHFTKISYCWIHKLNVLRHIILATWDANEPVWVLQASVNINCIVIFICMQKIEGRWGYIFIPFHFLIPVYSQQELSCLQGSRPCDNYLQSHPPYGAHASQLVLQMCSSWVYPCFVMWLSKNTAGFDVTQATMPADLQIMGAISPQSQCLNTDAGPSFMDTWPFQIEW